MRLSLTRKPRPAPVEPVPKDFDSFLESLSEDQKSLVVNVIQPTYLKKSRQPASALKPSMFMDYLVEYAKNPLSVVRRQNAFIGYRLWPFQGRWMRQAALLNARIEAFMHKDMPKVPDTRSHQELNNQDYLFQGDILPGRNFALGWPQTYFRELLLIKKDSPQTLKFTLAARALALKGISPSNIAKKLYEKLKKVKVNSFTYPVGEYIGPGTMMEYEKGVCRHKAAMLALCLQEAGIKARYVRGMYGGEPHAWVEAELEKSSIHILDPAMGHFYKKPEDSREGFLHSPFSVSNVVWRLLPA